MSGEAEKPRYGCADYREEMRLMGLKRLVEKKELTDAERAAVLAEIETLESRMGMS